MAINIIEEINKGDKVYYVSGANVCCGVVLENQLEKTFTRSRYSCSVKNDNSGSICCCTEVYRAKEEAEEVLLETLMYCKKAVYKQIETLYSKIHEHQKYVDGLNKRIEKLKK